MNWDFDEDRRDIVRRRWDDDHQLVVFDELHKYPRWKNWIKGIYDTAEGGRRFLVTGSARLDVYRRGGDSLLGRYHYWRLHPLTLDELPPKMTQKEGFKRLMSLGGFPEPFLGGSEREAARWRRERFDRVLKEDVRDLESIKKIQDLSLFVDILRRRAGQLIVLSNIAADLQISPKTAGLWLQVLNRMYICFSVPPYTKKLPRAVQKPPKVYFFDNADVVGGNDQEGPRFENLTASHLLKKMHYLEDSRGLRLDLRYIRDKESREVDFVLLREGEVFGLIEVKFSDRKISRSLQYYAEKLRPKHVLQITAHPKRERRIGKGRVVGIQKALRILFDNI